MRRVHERVEAVRSHRRDSTAAVEEKRFSNGHSSCEDDDDASASAAGVPGEYVINFDNPTYQKRKRVATRMKKKPPPEGTVKAEEVEGHVGGDKTIDELLQFIESKEGRENLGKDGKKRKKKNKPKSDRQGVEEERTENESPNDPSKNDRDAMNKEGDQTGLVASTTSGTREIVVRDESKVEDHSSTAAVKHHGEKEGLQTQQRHFEANSSDDQGDRCTEVPCDDDFETVRGRRKPKPLKQPEAEKKVAVEPYVPQPSVVPHPPPRPWVGIERSGREEGWNAGRPPRPPLFKPLTRGPFQPSYAPRGSQRSFYRGRGGSFGPSGPENRQRMPFNQPGPSHPSNSGPPRRQYDPSYRPQHYQERGPSPYNRRNYERRSDYPDRHFERPYERREVAEKSGIPNALPPDVRTLVKKKEPEVQRDQKPLGDRVVKETVKNDSPLVDSNSQSFVVPRPYERPSRQGRRSGPFIPVPRNNERNNRQSSSQRAPVRFWNDEYQKEKERRAKKEAEATLLTAEEFPPLDVAQHGVETVKPEEPKVVKETVTIEKVEILPVKDVANASEGKHAVTVKKEDRQIQDSWQKANAEKKCAKPSPFRAKWNRAAYDPLDDPPLAREISVQPELVKNPDSKPNVEESIPVEEVGKPSECVRMKTPGLIPVKFSVTTGEPIAIQSVEVKLKTCDSKELEKIDEVPVLKEDVNEEKGNAEVSLDEGEVHELAKNKVGSEEKEVEVKKKTSEVGMKRKETKKEPSGRSTKKSKVDKQEKNKDGKHLESDSRKNTPRKYSEKEEKAGRMEVKAVPTEVGERDKKPVPETKGSDQAHGKAAFVEEGKGEPARMVKSQEEQKEVQVVDVGGESKNEGLLPHGSMKKISRSTQTGPTDEYPMLSSVFGRSDDFVDGKKNVLKTLHVDVDAVAYRRGSQGC